MDIYEAADLNKPPLNDDEGGKIQEVEGLRESTVASKGTMYKMCLILVLNSFNSNSLGYIRLHLSAVQCTVANSASGKRNCMIVYQ